MEVNEFNVSSGPFGKLSKYWRDCNLEKHLDQEKKDNINHNIPRPSPT